MLSASQRTSLEKATAQYQIDLVNSAAGLSYLNGRGITTVEAETYRLGYVNNPIEGHDGFKGMISIPYLRPAGVIAMKFRRLDDGKPKYLNHPGAGAHLYNTDALRGPGRTVCICEGEFDAIILSSRCGLAAVGVPGASQWKGHPHWRRLFDGRQVLIFPDNDRSEENPGEKLAQEIAGSLDSARVVRLPAPQGEETNSDVTSVFLKVGRDEIRRLAGV